MAVLRKGKGELHMRTIRRLMLLMVLCLTLLGCGAALADVTITPVPAERIQLATEPGLVLTTQKQDGQFEIKIDPEKTDWSDVLTYGGTGEGGTELGAEIALPANPNVKYYTTVWALDVGGDFTPAQIKQYIQYQVELWGDGVYMDFEEYDSLPAFSMAYRDYSQKETLLALNEATSEVAVCWFDADKNLLSIETVVGTVKYTSSTRQIPNVKQHLISSSIVTPNAGEKPGFSATATDGNVSYTVDDPAAIDLTNGDHLQTRIKVPEGTVRIVTYNWWGVVKSVSTPTADGYFSISSGLRDGADLLKSMHISDDSYAFMDKDNNILPGGGLLWITVVNEKRLALHFLQDEDWNPIPESRFRYAITGDSGLVNVTYEDALVHISANQQANVSEADARKLPGAQKNYQVQAPTNAKSCRIGMTGGVSSFDARATGSWQMFLDASLSEDESTLLPVQGGQWVDVLPIGWGQNLFYMFASSENGSKLYTVSAETQIGHATYFVVEWFSDAAGKESLGVEWFAEDAEEITLRAKTYVVSDAAQVASQLDGPAVVYQSDDLILYAEYRAQSNENAYVIELKLMDLDGNIITDFSRLTQDGAVEFFIPYPQGLSADSDYTYAVTHYLDDGLKLSEPALEMQCEVGGIRFKLRSLSPVELSWQSNAPAPTTPSNPTVPPKPQVTPNPTVTANPQATPNPQTPPQTGDNTHILLWCSLCLVSLAAAAALLKKHRKA